MSLQEEIDRRGISEVVHFTTNRGLTGALAERFLLSRPLLKHSDFLRHVLKFNAKDRPEESIYFDKTKDWISFVNLSISEINRTFFGISQSWHQGDDDWWCILAFEARIMTHEGVYFATTNNAYDQCSRGSGASGFDALFAAQVARKSSGRYGPWNVPRATRPNHLTTCEQAEVLYPEKLDLEHLARIYVMEGEHQDKVVGLLQDFGYNSVEVVVSPEKFKGRKN